MGTGMKMCLKKAMKIANRHIGNPPEMWERDVVKKAVKDHCFDRFMELVDALERRIHQPDTHGYVGCESKPCGCNDCIETRRLMAKAKWVRII